MFDIVAAFVIVLIPLISDISGIFLPPFSLEVFSKRKQFATQEPSLVFQIGPLPESALCTGKQTGIQ